MSVTLYADALDHLNALGQELAPGTRRKWDLAHMRTLSAALGNPQAAFPSVLIAGTNGKGSTAATLASILTAAGCRTGLYTSPHLEHVTERIQIDAAEIPEEAFARLYFQVDITAQTLIEQKALPHPPSFFETLTALAFTYFAQEKIDIAILEVGLGGRLDATNIVSPLLSILTDIALDHQEYLGPTIAAITREKCGILRPGGTLITLPQHPEANQAIGEAAATLNLRALSAAPFIPHTPPRPNLPPQTAVILSAAKDPRISPTLTQKPVILSEGEAGVEGPAVASSLSFRSAAEESAFALLHPNRYTLTLDHEPLQVASPLPGQHQQRNLALAIAAAQELRNQHRYTIPNAAIETGIRNTRWPGRLELLRTPGHQDLLLDVAHNPAGAWTLRAAIAQLPEHQPRTLIFSCLQDKLLEEIARILFPLFDSGSEPAPGSPPSNSGRSTSQSLSGDPHRRLDHLILTQIDNPRATPLAQLLAAAHALAIPAHAAPHPAAALAQARAVTPPDGLILATGSVYLIGALRPLALNGPIVVSTAEA